jgi:hypothetical protein
VHLPTLLKRLARSPGMRLPDFARRDARLRVREPAHGQRQPDRERERDREQEHERERDREL